MRNQTMLSKTIGLHRTAIANTLAIFSTMQQHGEDILKTTLEQSPWLPESSKNCYLYCADFYAKYLENLKSVADLSLAQIEQISMPGLRPEERKTQQKTNTARIAPPPPAKKDPAIRKKKVRAKKTVVAKTTPDKKTVAQNAPTEKPVIQKIPTEKLLAQNVPAEKPIDPERPEVKKSTEVQTAISIPKPSVTSQTPAEPAQGNKESASQLLKPKG